MKENKLYIFMLWFVLITSVICYTVRGEIDKKTINKLSEENRKKELKLHDYEWQIEQYKYMLNKYCGCDNK